MFSRISVFVVIVLVVEMVEMVVVEIFVRMYMLPLLHVDKQINIMIFLYIFHGV